MKVRGKSQISVVELTLFVLLLVVGWAAYQSFRIVQQVDEVPALFRTSQAEYIVIAERLQPVVTELQQLLHRFSTKKDRADWDRFQRKSQELKAWIEEQKTTTTKMKVTMLKPVALTTDVGTLVDRIDTTFQLYMVLAQRMSADNSQPADPAPTAARFEQVDQKARELITLGSQARAHGEALQMFLAGSKEWFVWLRRLLFASMVALVALAGWLTVLSYRRIVSPLRLKLIESHSIIEQQKKQARFGELAAGVAHEIRNPLTAINARLFTLQRGLRQGSTEHEDATVIRDEIARLTRIVKDFLELARPSEPQLKPLTAGPVLAEVNDLLGPQYEKQSTELRIEAAVSDPFLADPQQLKQVLINLIQNAAQCMESGGMIRLRAVRDTRNLKGQSTDVVIIEVQDNGPGIPPEIQERLFDPFFSTKKDSTGLGLSIAARIIDNHGGAIEFRTQTGHGTTFGIVLPIHTPAS